MPDLEILYDDRGQWTDGSRERYQAAYTRTGKARGRRRRQVVPACSDPACSSPAFAESPEGDKHQKPGP